MLEYNKSRHLKKYVESLSIKYDMFYSNRQYKNVHFKTEDEYMIIQKNLSTEIEMLEKEIKEILKEWFQQNFENITFIAYDSRFICLTKYTHRIGKVLVKDANNIDLHKEINSKFNIDTDFDIIIENFEDLTDEVKKKFTF